VFLPASDIPSFVAKGDIDLGITGHDVILEAEVQGLVDEVLRLGFGKCALQVQVPEIGPIKTIDDLAGKRVVTSFEVLAGQYFKAVDERLGLKEDKKTKIEYVGGGWNWYVILIFRDPHCLTEIIIQSILLVSSESPPPQKKKVVLLIF
jgi:ATP phosphoribosyltransferase